MERTKMNDEKKQFYKMVFALVLPMALQNLINVGVTSADVIMLGRVGETALSASSLAGQVYFILNLVYFGLTSGAAVITAQYWGKGDTRTIEKVLAISLRFALLAGAVFTVAVWVIPEPIMGLLTNDPEIIREGASYLRIVGCSYVISGITMVYLNILRSVEKVVIATVVYAASLATNVVLNSIFIFGLLGWPAMGVAGAALGTCGARVVELAIVIWYAKKKNHILKFHFQDLFLKDRALMKDFRTYAVPVLLNELAWGGGMAIITAIMGHLGSAAVAANSVAQVARQLSMVVSFGVSSATAIVVGKTIGEGNKELAKTYAKRFVRLAFWLGLAGGGVILCVSPIASHFLTLTDLAREYLRYMMYVMAYFVVAQSLNSTLVVGVFRGGGDTRYGLILDLSTLWGGAIVMGLITAFVLKLPVPWVYVFLVSDEIIKLPFVFSRFRKEKWLKNITRADV
ncbi:MAG TPA: MATE family efflux transporter [Candidatus Pullilachnospira stercoravium]|uniref:MATE family efflux transporter n=1 Tax=Candidatus Pullilachnospira stercoravium TaxID=2840913 RepID=A0A9D1NWN6_9FIRM|nr:MATE family efflux transporter [Candidatus Pullilachnospira stercoravium]